MGFIEFKKVRETKAVRADLSRLYPIAKLARTTYGQVTVELGAQEIRQTMEQGEGNPCRLYYGAKSIEFSTTECGVKTDSTILLSGKVVVVETDLDGAVVPKKTHYSRVTPAIEPPPPTLAMDFSGIEAV